MITCYTCNAKVHKIDFTSTKIKKLKKCNFWLDFESPKHNDLKPLEKLFGIHHLVIEDCLTPQDRRPKIIQHKGYVHIVMYAVTDAEKAKLTYVNFILGKNFVITIHKNKIQEFDTLKKNKDELKVVLSNKADRVMHKLIDKLVDSYFPTLDEVNDELDKLEDKIIKNPDQRYLTDLFNLKRTVMKIKKIVSPQRDIMAALTKGNNDFVSEEALIYYRDIYDHLIWLNDQLDGIRDIISSTLEIHLSVVSNKMNEIMKVLTIIATIMLPLTVIGSIYGMNFKYMPELYWRYGYAGVWVVMILVAVGMVYYFKRRKWI